MKMHLPSLRRFRAYLFAAILLAVVGGFFYLSNRASAATLTWDGGGTTDNWSDCANWTTDACPASGDTVTFDATSTKDATVDASFTGTITTITIASGYTGTISLARSLTVSTTFSQAAGGFSASNQTLDLNGTFSLTAGTFTAPSTTMFVASTFTISAGTFNNNGGTVTFDGGTSATLSCNNATFNLVTFAQTAGTKTVSSNCSLPLGNNPTMGAGGASGQGVALSGTLSGTGTLTTATQFTFTLNAGAALSGFSGLHVISTLTINGATIDLGSYSLVDLNVFTLSSGANFTASSGTMTVASTFTLNSGTTFNANGGTVTFDGATSATLSCNNASFNLVTFAHTAGVKTVSSDCSLPLGNNPNAGNGGGITLNGTLSGTGTLTQSNTFSGIIFRMNSGSVLSGFSGLVVRSFTIDGVTTNFSSYTTLDMDGNFILQNGAVFTAPASVMTVAVGFTLNSGTTFNANGGTVTFDGASSATLSCNNTTFNLVTFTHSSTSVKTVSADCNLPLGNNPTIGTDTSNATGLTLNGTLSGSGILTFLSNTAGLLTINSTASLGGFSGLDVRGLTLSGSNTNFGSYSSFLVRGSFVLSSGAIFTAPSATMTININFTLNSGTTFNHNGGTVNFGGSNSATAGCNNAIFNHATLTHTAGTKTVAANCQLPLGANPTVSNAVLLQGTLSGSGTLTTTTGTFNLNPGSLLGFTGLVSGSTFTITGAVADFSTYTTLDVNASLTLSSGAIFTAPSGTMTVAGSFIINSGTTFNANGGTVTFDGGAGTLACNNTVFSHVNISNTGNTAKTVGADCNLPLGSNPVIGTVGDATTDVVVNGILTGTGILQIAGATTTNTITLNSTSSLAGFSGLIAGKLDVSGSTPNFGGYSTFDVNGDFVLRDGGTFTAPSDTATFASTFTLNSGTTFNANNGTVAFDGTVDQTPVCNSVVFNKVVINKPAGNFTVNSDCSLPLGTDPTVTLASDNGLFVKSILSGSGTLMMPAGTLLLDIGSSLSGFSGLVAANLTIDGATADFGSYTTLDVNGDFTLFKPGVFTAPAGTFTVAGNFSAGSNEGHLDLPGTSGNYASSPDSAATSIIGDLDLRVRVALDDWTPASTTDQALLSKYNATGGQQSYILQVARSTGNLGLFLSSTGSSNALVQSSVAPAVQDRAALWVRATYRVSDRRVQFFTSDDGSTWTQLGTDQTHTMTSIFDSTADVQVGTYNSGGSHSATGKFYEAQIRNNILDNGTGIVFDANFTNHADGTTSFIESSANGATVSVVGPDAHLYSTGAGTFNHNNGTVMLDGGDQTIVGTTFYNLTKVVSSAATLTLPAGSLETILGNLTLKGADGQLLSLVSSTPGTQWQIDAQGNKTIQYVLVRDSKNVGTLTLIAYDSTDGGGNSGWSFQSSTSPAASAPASSSRSYSSDTTLADGGTIPEPSEIPELLLKSQSTNAAAAKQTRQTGHTKMTWLKYVLGSWAGLTAIALLVFIHRRRLRRPTPGSTSY